MKTESQLQEDVMAELQWESRVDHANNGVAAKDVLPNSGQLFTQRFVADHRWTGDVRQFADLLSSGLRHDRR